MHQSFSKINDTFLIFPAKKNEFAQLKIAFPIRIYSKISRVSSFISQCSKLQCQAKNRHPHVITDVKIRRVFFVLNFLANYSLHYRQKYVWTNHSFSYEDVKNLISSPSIAVSSFKTNEFAGLRPQQQIQRSKKIYVYKTSKKQQIFR